MFDECQYCKKADSNSPTGCATYTHDISWVKRRGGCPIPERVSTVKKVKINPLKASKRSRR